MPTVSATPTRFTPIASTALYTLRRSPSVERNESSLEKRTSLPWSLMNVITLRASAMISSTDFPCENSRRYDEVPKRMSIPSTPVCTATLASSM